MSFLARLLGFKRKPPAAVVVNGLDYVPPGPTGMQYQDAKGEFVDLVPWTVKAGAWAEPKRHTSRRDALIAEATDVAEVLEELVTQLGQEPLLEIPGANDAWVRLAMASASVAEAMASLRNRMAGRSA